MDGKSYEYDCNEQTTLLEQALAQKISLPFSCMSGACTTCQAKLISGEVDMEDHSSLDDDEVERGQILTCQAKPLSDFVHVEIE
ncbi:MAG: 2Fe-2S iron-sulfur cluster-binding protein [Bacteriovoracales bacterium]|nr:2Fe-2S iron-sulfur cluster-binding protein [Bacteriovoracales bacterium]